MTLTHGCEHTPRLAGLPLPKRLDSVDVLVGKGIISRLYGLGDTLAVFNAGHGPVLGLLLNLYPMGTSRFFNYFSVTVLGQQAANLTITVCAANFCDRDVQGTHTTGTKLPGASAPGVHPAVEQSSYGTV